MSSTDDNIISFRAPGPYSGFLFGGVGVWVGGGGDILTSSYR